MEKKSDRELLNRIFIFGGAALIIIASTTLFTLPAHRVNDVEEIPLDKVVNYSIRGEIKRIEVRGDELLITKKGEAAPSLRSEKPPGSNLHEHGISLKDVEVRIVR